MERRRLAVSVGLVVGVEGWQVGDREFDPAMVPLGGSSHVANG